MSKCMTIADEAIDQKDTCAELPAKDIVGFILEEALVSAVIISDKSCSRIGDFNIKDDFCQQFDQIPAYSKEFDLEKSSSIPNSSTRNQEINLNSGENIDHSISLLTAKENLELILDSLVKKDEKIKNECKIISEETLADNELRIENGQIHIERNQKPENEGKGFSETVKSERKENKIKKDETVEIEYFNNGKLSKIYVPLSSTPSTTLGEVSSSFQQQPKEEKNVSETEQLFENIPEGSPNLNPKEQKNKMEVETEDKESSERPFTAVTTEELRQVWENENSSIVGDWDGGISAHPKGVVRLMEGLSSCQVYSESNDPHMPRACVLAEEDIKKMVKEIEEINFNHPHVNNPDEVDMALHTDGQGDVDLETNSVSAKSKDNLEKPVRSQKEDTFQDQEALNLTFNLSFSKESKESLENAVYNNIGTEEYVAETTFSKNSSFEGQNSSNSQLFSRTSINTIKLQGDTDQYLQQSASVDMEKTGSRNQIQSSTFSINNEEVDQFLPNLPSISNVESKTENINITTDDRRESRIFLTDSQNLLSYPEDDSEKDTSGLRLFQKTSVTSLKSQISNKTSDELENSKIFSENPKDSLRWSRSESDTPQDHDTDFNLLMAQGSSSTGKLKQKSNDNEWSFLGANSFTPLDASVHLIESKKITKTSVEPETFLQQFSLTSDKSKNQLGEVQNDSQTNEHISKDSPFCDVNAKDEVKESSSFSRNTSEVLQNVESLSCNQKNSDLLKNIESTSSIRKTSGLLQNVEKEQRSSDEKLFAAESEEEKQSLQEVKESDSKEKPGDQKTDDPNANQTEKSASSQVQSSSSFPESSSQSEEEDTDTMQSKSSADFPDKFKLHSQKMYLGVNYDPAGRRRNDFILSDSEDAFIESTENVIQIIEPQDSSNEEESQENISFSLLSEYNEKQASTSQIQESQPEDNFPSNSGSEVGGSQTEFDKKIYSGMSTIGPIKYADYDPKDLTGTEIDFGKMKLITSSRQLTKDIFGMEIKAIPSVKVVEEDDSEEDENSLNVNQSDRLDIGSLVNRDIASLTKVQKVKEVMSYHPKPDEDFEDDESLTRTRLDLKDVESMTDERFKVPDVNLPLLSIDVGDENSETDKEFIQNMDIVLGENCFNNASYYEDEDDESNYPIPINPPVFESNDMIGFEKTEDADEILVVSEPVCEFFSVREPVSESISEKKLETSSDSIANIDDEFKGVTSGSQRNNDFRHQKYATLSSVFKKASIKFARKDGDLLLRNAKSLPRDATKLSATESIKSIFDECQSSASNVLKKSRSLLRNTQSIFKTLSQGRFSTHDTSAGFEKQKPSPSESNIGNMNTVEKKLSFLRKEDLMKAKNLIKSKVEKTFGCRDSSTIPIKEQETTADKKELRVAVRNKENYRVDRIENFRKLLPKSPLVYKSQFVKSQVSVLDDHPEFPDAASTVKEPDSRINENSKISLFRKSGEKTFKEEPGDVKSTISTRDSEKEIQITFDEKTNEVKLSWSCNQYSYQINQEYEHQQQQQPDYIVMETFEGLPIVDFESSPQDIENRSDKAEDDVENDVDKGYEDALAHLSAGVPSKYQMNSDSVYSVPSYLSDNNDESLKKTDSSSSSSRRVKAKTKKFSERFRSFWCSTFRRLKTPPKNVEPS